MCCPVIQARPVICGMIVVRSPTRFTSNIFPIKREPMIDEWISSSPTPIRPRAWSTAIRAEVPVPVGKRSERPGGTMQVFRVTLPLPSKGIANCTACLQRGTRRRWCHNQRPLLRNSFAYEAEHVALPRSNGYFHAGRVCETRSMGAAGVHGNATSDAPTVCQLDRDDATILNDVAADLALKVVNAKRARLPAKCLQHSPAVEPALAGQPQAAAGNAIHVQPWEH